MSTRLVPLQGGINFRDLGGYRSRDGRQVKWRKILRSGHLASLTEADLATLAEIGVTEIHDFRRSEEQQRTPSQPVDARVIDDYQMYIGSMSKFWDFLLSGQLSADSAHQLVVDSYRGCADEVAPAYRRLFRYLLANTAGASLFHCAAGKDRTGLAAALILSALDVPRDTIIEDYLLTQEHYDSSALIDIIESHLRNADVGHWERQWLMPYCSVSEENIHAFFEGVEQGYGSVGNYLSAAIKLSDSDLKALKAGYLEGL